MEKPWDDMDVHITLKEKAKKEVSRRMIRITSFFFLLTILVIYLGLSVIDFSTETAQPIYTEPVRRPGCVCPLEHNLPILYINTHGQDITQLPGVVTEEIAGTLIQFWKASDRYRVQLVLYEPGEYGYTCTCGVALPSFSQEIYINLRGQSSLNKPKQQYTLTLNDENGTQEPAALLGMPAHHKWVLNGSYADKSLIRNALAYTMAGQTMEYAPAFRYCEVLLNNGTGALSFDTQYMGVYLLTEKIERGTERINIRKPDPRYGDLSFMLARDKTKEGDDIYQTDWGILENDFTLDADGLPRLRTVFKSVYPSDGMTPDYRERIIAYINELEYALGSSRFDSPGGGYSDYIDTHSFVMYAMVNEVFKNIDGGIASAYFYKDLGSKLKAGPVWDFDLSLGNRQILAGHMTDQDWYEPTGLYTIEAPWFSRLFQDQAFSASYQDQYRLLRETEWSDEAVSALIDQQLTMLGPAAQRNADRWYPVTYDHKEEIEEIRHYLLERMAWMDRNIHLVFRIKQ